MTSKKEISSSEISTRKAYGLALAKLGKDRKDIIALDAETSNSTFADEFKKLYPERFVECFIAEQNMVSIAVGLSRMGKKPFVSTFAAFFSRAFDQIRMCQYSQSNITFVGSHAGVSIGEDGSSQMALEDLAMFRSLQGFTVLYPSDATSMEAMVKLAADTEGNHYIRSTRANTPVIYSRKDTFKIGGSKTLFSSETDVVTLISAGITLHESINAYSELLEEGINVRVIDLYSIKPIDKFVIEQALDQTGCIIVIEDHHREGGIFEAVCSAASETNHNPIYSLAVTQEPRSGKPRELLEFEQIDTFSIVSKVKEIVSKN